MITLNDALTFKYVTIIGYFFIIKFLVYLIYKSACGFRTFVWSRIRPFVDLKSTYGAWAVVTGSTDGIGKEFAKEMARRGMNVVLISRNELKLKMTAAALRTQFDVDVKYIQADFTSTNVYDKIRKELEGLDIGILVNNVGFSNEGREIIADQTEEFFKGIVNTNILATVICSSIVLQKMKIKKRGLILNMGSQSGITPVPYIGVYSSTKAFIDFFSSCLSTELADYNIHVKCFRGGFIATKIFADMSNLHKFLKKFAPFSFPNPDVYVRSAMATINTDVTFTAGYWCHALLMFLAETFIGRTGLEKFSTTLMSSSLIWGKQK